MPTAACYLGQALVLAITAVFAARALGAGMRGLAIWLALIFGIVVLGWDCRYTVAVEGDGNVVIRSCGGSND